MANKSITLGKHWEDFVKNEMEYFMKYNNFMLVAVAALFMFVSDAYAACNYPSDLDSAGRRCGGRAASVIPGGNLGGDGRYEDSQGRQRVYGRGNDQYDSRNNNLNQNRPNPNSGFNNNSQSNDSQPNGYFGSGR
jgi:hypothetical protein